MVAGIIGSAGGSRAVHGPDSVYDPISSTTIKSKPAHPSSSHPTFLLSICVTNRGLNPGGVPASFQVVALFRPMGLRHLPVVDKYNAVVGMITRKDLVEPALVEALAGVAGWQNPKPRSSVGGSE